MLVAETPKPGGLDQLVSPSRKSFHVYKYYKCDWVKKKDIGNNGFIYLFH